MEKESKLLWSNEQENDINLAEDLASIIKENMEDKQIMIEAKNIDWLGHNGYKVVDLTADNEDIYCNILPAYECTFELFKDEDGLYAMVYSHDVPTGSCWRFNSLKKLNSNPSRKDKENFVVDSYMYFRGIDYDGMDGDEVKFYQENIKKMTDDELNKEIDSYKSIWHREKGRYTNV